MRKQNTAQNFRVRATLDSDECIQRSYIIPAEGPGEALEQVATKHNRELSEGTWNVDIASARQSWHARVEVAEDGVKQIVRLEQSATAAAAR